MLSRDTLLHRSNCLIFARFKHTRRMAKERKSPQEKKELEYKFDRRSFAWHQDKGLRIARRRRKDTINRAYRHKADSVVRQGVDAKDLASEDNELTNSLLAVGLTKKRLRKFTPPTLKDAVALKTEHRETRKSGKSQRAEAHERHAISIIEALEQAKPAEAVEFLSLSVNFLVVIPN